MNIARSVVSPLFAFKYIALIALFPTIAASQASFIAPSKSAAAGLAEQSIHFGFDDLMTLLIQPRHLKLFYAGTQGNWELAAAEMRDLRASFAFISTAHPKYLKNDVQDAIATMIAPQLLELDDAIATADAKSFNKRFKGLTEACNACHTYMEHPYIVITVPQVPAKSAYPNQDFREPL